MNLQDLRDEARHPCRLRRPAPGRPAARCAAEDPPHQAAPCLQRARRGRRTRGRRRHPRPHHAPDAAGRHPPEDYTRDGLTVPGTVGSDKLLKAWIGDRGQSSLTFVWTPTTNSIAFHAACEATGMYAIRFRINGWYVAGRALRRRPEAWRWTAASPSRRTPLSGWAPRSASRAEVTAELIDLESAPAGRRDSRIWFGIYSTASDPPSSNGAPARLAPVDAGAYQKDGVVYRKTVGGDTLAAAKVADPAPRGAVQLHRDRSPVVLHGSVRRTADSGGDNAAVHRGDARRLRAAGQVHLRGELDRRRSMGSQSHDRLAGAGRATCRRVAQVVWTVSPPADAAGRPAGSGRLLPGAAAGHRRDGASGADRGGRVPVPARRGEDRARAGADASRPIPRRISRTSSPTEARHSARAVGPGQSRGRQDRDRRRRRVGRRRHGASAGTPTAPPPPSAPP